MAVLSFLGNVEIAVRIVRGKYPDAVLYEVDGATDNVSTKDTKAIDKLRCVWVF